MKKLVSTLCAAGICFGIAAIIQAEKPSPSGLWEIIPGDGHLNRFISSAPNPVNDMDGIEGPLVPSWSPVELKRLGPNILPATYQKKKVKPSDVKSRNSATFGDDLPPPPVSEIVSASMERGIDAPQEMSGRLEKQALVSTESKNKTFTYYPKSLLTIHQGSYGVLHDVISHLDKNPSARVDIRAFADSSGNINRNLVLARKRVNDIRTYLILHDISDEIITVEILEATNLLESSQTIETSPLKHRVDITIR